MFPWDSTFNRFCSMHLEDWLRFLTVRSISKGTFTHFFPKIHLHNTVHKHESPRHTTDPLHALFILLNTNSKSSESFWRAVSSVTRCRTESIAMTDEKAQINTLCWATLYEKENLMKAAGSFNAIPNTDPESVKWTSLCTQGAELNQPGETELYGGHRWQRKMARSDGARLLKRFVLWVTLFSNAWYSAETVAPAVSKAQIRFAFTVQDRWDRL